MFNNAIKQNLTQNVPASNVGFLTTNSTFIPVNPNSYSSLKNAKFSANSNNTMSIEQRWKDTLASASASVSALINNKFSFAVNEFRRRNPQWTKWNDIILVKSINVKMSQIKIDVSMQRALDTIWVLDLLISFTPTKIVPIQVYQPDPNVDEYHAWDGQHTITLLWLIAVQIFNMNPDDVDIPVNIYSTSQKAEIRNSFISLNSKEGKKQLEAIDIWEQQVFGVRVDGSKNPKWIDTEQKHSSIQNSGLFVTAAKFGDTKESGAISRLQELNKFSVEVCENLAKYLNLSTNSNLPQREADEKEIVMMSHYFDFCEKSGVAVNDQYIFDLYNVLNQLFGADFDHSGVFWDQVVKAYHNWHNQHGFTMYGRCSKEIIHGMPFLIAQLNKSFTRPVPRYQSNSPFVPLVQDLF